MILVYIDAASNGQFEEQEEAFRKEKNSKLILPDTPIIKYDDFATEIYVVGYSVFGGVENLVNRDPREREDLLGKIKTMPAFQKLVARA